MNVKLDDLVLAHEWVSADAGGDNEACVCPASGAIHYFEAGVPVDPDSPVLAALEETCVAVPGKWTLDLGKHLALRFVRMQLPQAEQDVRECFRHRGACSRFKRLLEREGKLRAWYAFEEAAVNEAQLAWAETHGIPVEADGGPAA